MIPKWPVSAEFAWIVQLIVESGVPAGKLHVPVNWSAPAPAVFGLNAKPPPSAASPALLRAVMNTSDGGSPGFQSPRPEARMQADRLTVNFTVFAGSTGPSLPPSYRWQLMSPRYASP